MEKTVYRVLKINGDYAIMETVDISGNSGRSGKIENTVAMALLPIEICEGDRVVYEELVYRIENK